MKTKMTLLTASTFLLATAVSFAQDELGKQNEVARPKMGVTTASSEDPLLRANLQKRLDQFGAVFGTPKKSSVFFTEDAMVINPLGHKAKGRAEIEALITNDLNTVAKGATKHQFVLTNVRSITPNVVFIDAEHTPVGALTKDGQQMKIHLSALLIKSGNDWLIAEARPTVFLPPVQTTPAVR